MTARVVYTDLDGTMVGPGGNFFVAEDGSPTLVPAQALLDLHAAGAVLVLVSGRTRPQLVEACRIFGADGFVGELGAVLGWDAGRSSTVLRGEMPVQYTGRTPIDVLASLGVVEELFTQWPGRLEWHSPWHVGHEADAMLRGKVNVSTVDGWLRERGLGWLRLRDNGVLPARRPTTLRPEAVPAHVYHLMPAGLSKGRGVAADLARRGLTRADAVAIGDSVSDLDMAAYVERMWVVANGARQAHVRARLDGLDNARVADEAVGLGWAQAVRAAVGGQTSSAASAE
jgi:hydroxymethylpyrimidine pyrophosphatase-like HAD family hydrolase